MQMENEMSNTDGQETKHSSFLRDVKVQNGQLKVL